MAGGHGGFEPVKRENVYQHFKFTRKTTRQVFTWGFIVPAAIALISVTFDNKYDWAGKQKGSSLLRGTPAKPAPPAEE
ncbi:hypothetical protein I316_07552 [Kwoniella heveanensis BCC8398]|uniref:NADH dehydrogenase [ubiquinone] 1 beta subcomplex subunit 4 n=1 Tax=Kwoniella heveanensis BCC8398 TaxID=1296120 RepID=A0A1B9GII1_9TREE|nr:hypothetical protein I316_07552 [Kwoniella heveanensis BCC8398]